MNLLRTTVYSLGAGRNARADSFMDSAHENFFQKNILARNIKTTCGIFGILGIFDIIESAKSVNNVTLRN